MLNPFESLHEVVDAHIENYVVEAKHYLWGVGLTGLRSELYDYMSGELKLCPRDTGGLDSWVRERLTVRRIVFGGFAVDCQDYGFAEIVLHNRRESTARMLLLTPRQRIPVRALSNATLRYKSLFGYGTKFRRNYSSVWPGDRSLSPSKLRYRTEIPAFFCQECRVPPGQPFWLEGSELGYWIGLELETREAGPQSTRYANYELKTLYSGGRILL